MVRKSAQTPEDESLTVSEAAAQLGVTPATLRNWDRSGKLKPHRHPMNGYRIYAKSQIEALKNAIRGQKG
ncbi:MAG: MerR family DNA-binding transcriptional regulator [Stellaceae bacterium]